MGVALIAQTTWHPPHLVAVLIGSAGFEDLLPEYCRGRMSFVEFELGHRDILLVRVGFVDDEVSIYATASVSASLRLSFPEIEAE